MYNRSGQVQQVILDQSVTGASSGLIGTTHQLGDLDGEIYLKTKDRTDRNGDGVVNVLDLILVAQAFGTPAHDMNGDGTTNILDLIRLRVNCPILTSREANTIGVLTSLHPLDKTRNTPSLAFGNA